MGAPPSHGGPFDPPQYNTPRASSRAAVSARSIATCLAAIFAWSSFLSYQSSPIRGFWVPWSSFVP